MILHRKSSVLHEKKLLALINEVSKATKHKINIQKSVHQLTIWRIKKIMPFTIASKTVRSLGINLTKEVKHLYIKNCKALKVLKWNDTRVHESGELRLFKCPYCPKPSTDPI